MARKFIVSLLFLAPATSFAAFPSVESLLESFAKTGYDTIMEFPSGDFSSSPSVKVHEINENGSKYTKSLEQFAKGRAIRIPELDYAVNPQALLAFDKVVEAKQLADVFLCYYEGKKIVTCFMFPVSISKVIEDLKTANVIN